jgi:hypothetical protein
VFAVVLDSEEFTFLEFVLAVKANPVDRIIATALSVIIIFVFILLRFIVQFFKTDVYSLIGREVLLVTSSPWGFTSSSVQEESEAVVTEINRNR